MDEAAYQAMGELEVTLTDVIRAATNGPISMEDAHLLCIGCGLNVRDVLPGVELTKGKSE